MAQIDREALELVADDLEQGAPLTFEHIGVVFGDDFWMLLVTALMDAQDAARAIQGAISRLRTSQGEDEDEDDFLDDDDA